MRAQHDRRTAWHYPAEVTPGQREVWQRGRIIGGSSSINGMVYGRGDRLEEIIASGEELGWRRVDDLNAGDDDRIAYAAYSGYGSSTRRCCRCWSPATSTPR
ncbi:GMC oxidoreductase [Micromonospora avicenniae]|uniref:GMC oxidoreductase n=1 Tax=Micromonospora avicenniae TaxID=1198245 RepID=A0A1N6VIM4_9ACTN|nr:GMC oxidoreductase [Micromonospora avicenniae]